MENPMEPTPNSNQKVFRNVGGGKIELGGIREQKESDHRITYPDGGVLDDYEQSSQKVFPV